MEVEMNIKPAQIGIPKDALRSRALNELDDTLEATNNHHHKVANGGSNTLAGDFIIEEDDEDDGMVVADEEAVVKPKPSLKSQRSTSSVSSTKSGGSGAAAAKERLLRKAKRTGRDRAYSTSEDGKFGGCPTLMGASNHHQMQLQQQQQKMGNKNCRKPRNGAGRGLPKKGGAGGKGTWGKLGCELVLPWVDPNDPNYVSDEDVVDNLIDGDQAATPAGVTKTIAAPHGSHTALKTMVPEMSEEDVTKAVEPLILEYFENNDAMEVLCTLQEMLMNLGSRRWMVISIMVELAMDHKPSHREMASVLISELYLKVISQRDIGKAFDHLLHQLPDLILDTPEAPDVLGNFVARAIADDCIPPKFLNSYKGSVDSDEAKATLKKADTLLSMKHGLVRLDNVWGVGGGVRPVKYLVKKIVLLLKEYLCSGDVKEATMCLQDLEVPHFHHELVYEAIVMVIESMHEKTDEAMCKLLESLFRSFIITIDQMRNGFWRVYDLMPDIAIDVPAAYGILERFVLRCRKEGILTDDLVRKMPTRGRKRFVSEGDGGRVKVDLW